MDNKVKEKNEHIIKNQKEKKRKRINNLELCFNLYRWIIKWMVWQYPIKIKRDLLLI